MNELIFDMDEDKYFSHPAISNSKLKPLEKSGAHFLAALDEPSKTTPAQHMGKLIHASVLEPKKLKERYEFATRKLDMRKKEDKEYKASVIESGRELVAIDDAMKVAQITGKVQLHEGASKLLFDLEGSAEVSAFWTDEETGVECKGRFDYLTDSGFIVDLKTTVDADEENFKRTIANFKYYRQAAMYIDAYQTIKKQACKGFIIVAVEKESPYEVACYRINDAAIEQGRREYKALLRTYKACKDNNSFKGYSPLIEDVGLPLWALDEDLRNE